MLNNIKKQITAAVIKSRLKKFTKTINAKETDTVIDMTADIYREGISKTLKSFISVLSANTDTLNKLIDNNANEIAELAAIYNRINTKENRELIQQLGKTTVKVFTENQDEINDYTEEQLKKNEKSFDYFVNAFTSVKEEENPIDHKERTAQFYADLGFNKEFVQENI